MQSLVLLACLLLSTLAAPINQDIVLRNYILGLQKVELALRHQRLQLEQVAFADQNGLQHTNYVSLPQVRQNVDSIAGYLDELTDYGLQHTGNRPSVMDMIFIGKIVKNALVHVWDTWIAE